MRQEAGSGHVCVTVETAWEDAHPGVPMATSRAGLGRGQWTGCPLRFVFTDT